MPEERGKELVRRFWEDIFNNRNAASVDQVISPEFVLSDISTGSKLEYRNVQELVTRAPHHNPQVVIQEQLAAEQGHVVTRLAFQTVHRNSGSDLVELNAIAISYIGNDRILRTDIMWDTRTHDDKVRPEEFDPLSWRFPWW